MIACKTNSYKIAPYYKLEVRSAVGEVSCPEAVLYGFNKKADFSGDIVPIYNWTKANNKNIEENMVFDDIQQKYAGKIILLKSKYDDPSDMKLGIELIKLSNECNKEIILRADKNNIDYLSFLDVSVKDLKKSVSFIDRMFNMIEKNNPAFWDNHRSNINSFKAKELTKNILTDEQRKKAHLTIHSYSLMCAGVSALMGEANATGADIPILCAIETGMFGRLMSDLDTSVRAGMLHAAKHMFSAKLVGGRTLMWLNSLFALGGHAVAAPTTGGIGNVGISAYLRTSNAALSALLCEYMGWMFVNDYKNGKMNVKHKSLELAAFLVFLELTKGFNNSFDLENPAHLLEDKTLKSMGAAIAHNMSGSSADFVSAAMKFLAQNPLSKAAKGIELVTPAIAKHLVENNGKLNEEFLETVIKGSVYSLICSDLIGDIDNDAIIKEKAQKYIAYLRNDPVIKEMIDKDLFAKGIKTGAKCVIDKNTVKSLEALYNELVPRCVEIIKTTRSM